MTTQHNSSSNNNNHQRQSTSESSGDAVSLIDFKSSIGSNNSSNNSDAPPTSTSPQQKQRAPPADAAAANVMMAQQQQYGGTPTAAEAKTTSSGYHPTDMTGYSGGRLSPQQYLPPPTYDMNMMTTSWDPMQLQQHDRQHHHQQPLSPILYHHHMSPPGQGGTHHNNNNNNNLTASLQQPLSPSLQHYPYMYNPYAPPQGSANSGSGVGGPIPPPAHMQFYSVPPYGYPMLLPVNPQQQQQQQQQSYPSQQGGSSRPPRRSNSSSHDNRRSGGAAWSSKPNESKILSVHVASSSGDLPDVSEIFSSVLGGPGPGHSYMSPLVDNSASGGGGVSGPGRNGGGGYGSIPSPKVYNAPPPASSSMSSSSARRLPPSGRSPTSARNTDSANDFLQQQQQPKKRKSPPSNLKTSIHRRTHSDTLLRGLSRLKRVNSSDFLPPSGNRHNRSRTLSGGNPLVVPTHRRTHSASSMKSQGDMSQVSIRSNIAKSSLFAGVDPSTGKVLMHFPYEAIRLVMIPDASKQQKKQSWMSSISTNKNYQSIPSYDEDINQDFSYLTLGHLYADGPVNAESYYEDYIKVSDDLEQGMTPQWESLEANPKHVSNGGGICLCQCANCNTCIGKQELLPPDNYILPVSDDIYRRMLAEVASARNMPCGLFYCGHHEDVAHPSIWIAGTLVIVLFGTLIFLAFYTECNTLECLST